MAEPAKERMTRVYRAGDKPELRIAVRELAALALGDRAAAMAEYERLLELEARLANLETRGISTTGIGRISRSPTSDRPAGYWDAFWTRRSLEGN